MRAAHTKQAWQTGSFGEGRRRQRSRVCVQHTQGQAGHTCSAHLGESCRTPPTTSYIEVPGAQFKAPLYSVHVLWARMHHQCCYMLRCFTHAAHALWCPTHITMRWRISAMKLMHCSVPPTFSCAAVSYPRYYALAGLASVRQGHHPPLTNTHLGEALQCACVHV